MKPIKACYTEAILPEHQGNPLIEALPRKLTDQEMVWELGNYPNCSDWERERPPHERTEFLSRIEELAQPLPEYIPCFRMIELAMRNSYSSKNPFSPTTNYYLSYLSHSLPPVVPKTGAFRPKSKAMTVMGISGVGKSQMIFRCLNYFPQLIEHKEYEGNPLSINQVTWLYVECSFDSTLRGLCHMILNELDDVLNIEDKDKVKPAATIAPLLDQIERRIKSCYLGLLVIDELQALSIAKAGGANKLLGFLLNLINRCGVPILFCGDSDIEEILQITFKVARRAESGGFIEMKPLDCDKLWELFVTELWKLQWTNTFTPLTPALELRLYELSAGILDIAARIFHDAQKLVIGSGDERITTAVLERVQSGTCRLTEPGLVFLRRKTDNSDLQGENQSIEQQPTSSLSSARGREGISSKNIITGDLTRAHHPEFFEKLTELNLSIDLRERISDPDLFQQVSCEDYPVESLRQRGLICDDPLGFFS